MFLPEDKWSPRYESHFYTMRLNEYHVIRDPATDWPTIGNRRYDRDDGDDDDDDGGGGGAYCSFCRGGGRRKFPAVYYEIEILRGGGGGGGGIVDGGTNNVRPASSSRVLRRYSQFDALCRKLDSDGSLGLWKRLPPKTYTLDSWRSGCVIHERMEGLRDFLIEVLSRREFANLTIVSKFLELED